MKKLVIVTIMRSLLLAVAAFALAYGALEDSNRMRKSLYLYQIKEWSSFEPSQIDSAVKELLQAGESLDINGLHFDAAATRINGDKWVADCVEENTGVTHRTGAYSDPASAMNSCIEDLRSTVVVSVAETIQKGSHTIGARAQQLWQGARDALNRASTRAEQGRHRIQDKYREFADAATRRCVP